MADVFRTRRSCGPLEKAVGFCGQATACLRPFDDSTIHSV